MARNQEKAQSMLFRFRETQAIEMGIARPAGARRPRMASSVSSLVEAEKWRGEIMRDISRKVSKIQDAGLTDYAIRDLNDDINKLLREKSHWERQIVTLGGANYRRARTNMIDEDGREVPGTRGYKYFGRAKDLPGVKELFTRAAVQESEEVARAASYAKFQNNGPEYFGDIDELDADLVEEERAMEQEDWKNACAKLNQLLDLPEDTPALPYPTASTSAAAAAGSTSSGAGKRKAPASDADVDMDGDAEGDADKRAKTSDAPADSLAPAPALDAATTARISSFFGVLDASALQAPRQPSRSEMEAILLDVRKRALLEEYGV